jgi:hypothetical protein
MRLDMRDPSEIAFLEQRLAVAEAQLRWQHRMLLAGGGIVAVILAGLLIPDLWGVVQLLLLSVGVIGGVLLFISCILGMLEWWSPAHRLPTGPQRHPRPPCNP